MVYYMIYLLPHSIEMITVGTKFRKFRYNQLPMSMRSSVVIF